MTDRLGAAIAEGILEAEGLDPSLNGRRDQPRKLAAPVGISDLLAAPEPQEEWLAEGILPAGGNVLLAAYPKSFKTLLTLELGVALATGTPFLGRFRVPERRRAAVVLMEDQAHRVRRRLHRICQGRGIDLADLDGWLWYWFRPPLRLTDKTVVELGQYARELDLDFLAIDSWSYVASGDSNSADEVTPQLQALSACRLERPGLTVQLTHHARKERGENADGSRLTDIIRNSGAFGAWYDAGLVLARPNETAPVTVRAELRDYPTPEPFAFTVEDEDPAGPQNGHRSSGWLRLLASEEAPATVVRRAAAEKLLPAVRALLAEHPEGVSRKGLRQGIKGTNADVEAAFELLRVAGEAEHVPPARKGLAGTFHLLKTDIAEHGRTLPAAIPGDPLPTWPAPPLGGQARQGLHLIYESPGHGHVCPDCGKQIGPTADRCARCQYGNGGAA